MRLDHKQQTNPFAELNTGQKLCYIAAIGAAFISVFIWFFKILFF